MQNPTPWIFHVLMTTTFELRDNYQLTVHLFCCRTKARGWIWAVPLVFRMMSSCASASQAVGISGVIPLTLKQNKRRFVHFIIMASTVREMSICHQQHHPLFLFSHSGEIYLWDGTHSIQWKRNLCQLIHKSESWFRQKEGILKKKLSTSFIVGYQWENQLNVLLACTGCVGLSCFILLSFEQIPTSWWKNHDTHFAIWTISWFRIHPLPVGVQHPLSTQSCQQFRKHKKGRKSVPSTCQTRPLRVQVHMPENKPITHKSNFE